MKRWICTMALLWVLIFSAWGQEKEKPGTGGAKAAITQLARDYEAAYNKGDAKALGELFAEDVEYTDEDGVVINGREAVENLLKRGFVTSPGAKMQIQIQSIRDLAPGVATERGKTLITSPDGKQISSAYTAVHVLGDGKWHIKQLVDSPVPSPSASEMLSQLGWMVGTWKDKEGGTETETKVEWAKGGNFLTRNIVVTEKGETTLQGWQIIGWDPAAGQIRSWLFDSEGAFQEGTWTRTGDSWLIRQAGVLPDGATLSAENTFKRISNDKCTWETANRTLDGDPYPSLPRIEMTRVK